MLDRRPDLATYPEAVAAWAEAEAQCLLLRRYAAEHGLLTDDGDPRSFMKLAGTVEGRAERLRARLGLDPLADAELARSRASAAIVAVDLSAVMEAGRRVLHEQTTARVGPPPDRAGELLAAAREEGAQQWAAAVAGHEVDHQVDHEVDHEVDHGLYQDHHDLDHQVDHVNHQVIKPIDQDHDLVDHQVDHGLDHVDHEVDHGLDQDHGVDHEGADLR